MGSDKRPQSVLSQYGITKSVIVVSLHGIQFYRTVFKHDIGPNAQMIS